MKPKGKSKREFIFISSFPLKDATSRLRSLAQKHRWQIDLQNIDNDSYSFRLTRGKWLPATVSGSLRQDNNNTLITGKGEVDWTRIFMISVVGVGLALYQQFSVLGIGARLIHGNPVYPGIMQGDPVAWAWALIYGILLLLQFGVAAAFYLSLNKLYYGHQELRAILEKSLTDAIPDLPRAVTFSDEDGELMPLEDDLPVAEGKAKLRP